MASEEEIINIALGELGADMVLFGEEQTENARLLSARLPSILDTVLRAHPWNCAMARKKVAADAEKPEFGWAYQYTLPADPYCLRAWRVNEGLDGRGAKFQVEGRKLLTNETSPIELRFIKRVTDLSEVDAITADAIGVRLAAALGFRITQSRSRTNDAWDHYATILKQARSVDAQEGTPDEPESDDFLGARS